MNTYHLDYETRSRQDLLKVGAFRYAECPDARILMFGISSDTEGPFIWINPEYETEILSTDPRALRLLAELEADPDALVFAHNCQFERAVTMFIDGPVSFMRGRPTAWRCTASMARKAAIPDSLDGAAATLGLSAQKDNRGKALIKKFSEPRDDGTFMMASEDPLAFAEFADYCLQDVRVEKELHARLKPFELSGIALEGFLLDIHLNDRGVPVNIKALQNASRILAECYAEANEKFRALTGLNPTQREKVRCWCNDRGAKLENMQGEYLDEWMEKDAERRNEPTYQSDQGEIECAEAVRMYADLNFAAAKKVDVMLACVNSDGFVRGTLLWHGAGTGRSSGRLIQPQNFKKPTIKDTDIAYQMICNGCTREDLDLVFGNPLEIIASCIRHFIDWVSPEGVKLGEMLDADYNAVEARVANWVAGQDDVVETFRSADNWTGPKDKKPDPYKKMAGFVYNVPWESIKNPSVERDVGKTLELGCQFGLAADTLYTNCVEKKLTFMTPELAKLGVTAYRQSHDKVQQCWWDCDTAVKRAIRQPNVWFNVGLHLGFCVKKHAGIVFLLFRLPSGRNIVFPMPEVNQEPEEDYKVRLKKNPKVHRREHITYWGCIKGKTWGRCRLYGSIIFQNCVQAIAGDLLMFGMNATRRIGYDVFTAIHDQALALMRPGQTVPGYAAALATLPPWANGLPLKAEAKITPYYTKV